VLARLGGGCTVPVAAFALREGTTLWLRAALGGPEGASVRLLRAEGRGEDPEALGTQVAESLLSQGGLSLLEAARSAAPGLPAPKRA